MIVYRYLSIQDGQAKTANFPYNLYLEDKHQLRDTENVTKQQKEVLGIILLFVYLYICAQILLHLEKKRIRFISCFWIPLIDFYIYFLFPLCCCGLDRMVVRFTTTYQ